MDDNIRQQLDLADRRDQCKEDVRSHWMTLPFPLHNKWQVETLQELQRMDGLDQYPFISIIPDGDVLERQPSQCVAVYLQDLADHGQKHLKDGQSIWECSVAA